MRSFISLSILVLAIKIQSFAFSYPTNHSLFATSAIKDSNAFYFSFDNANFLWDNEFFSDVVEGYTLIGYYLMPQLQYHFSPHLKIDAGANFLKYSGIDGYSKVIPTYSVTYSKNNYSLIMGTLKGSIYHKVAEPLLFSERYFTDNIENGVQYLLSQEKIWLDVWLDWQTFIVPNDNKQEELLLGINALPRIIKKQNFEIDGVATLLTGHRGGQIDTTNKNIRTAINYGIGFNISQGISNKWIDKISLESQYVGFYDNSPTVESIYGQGGGYMNNLRFSKNESYIQIGHWSANKFLSMMGHPIYQCYSSVDSLKHAVQRNLFTANLFYSKAIFSGVYLGLMGDIFYDMDAKSTDYSMGLTLILKQDFFLTRFERKKSKLDF